VQLVVILLLPLPPPHPPLQPEERRECNKESPLSIKRENVSWRSTEIKAILLLLPLQRVNRELRISVVFSSLKTFLSSPPCKPLPFLSLPFPQSPPNELLSLPPSQLQLLPVLDPSLSLRVLLFDPKMDLIENEALLNTHTIPPDLLSSKSMISLSLLPPLLHLPPSQTFVLLFFSDV